MFMGASQRFLAPLVMQGVFAANTTSSIPLKNLGYLAEVRLIFTINFTVVLGGGSAVAVTGRGKASGNPTPFDLISRVQLFNNQNNALVDVSGWGLYLHNQAQRSGYDPNFLTGSLSPINNNPFYTQQPNTGNQVTGSYVVPLTVPVAYKKSLQGGLLFMQNQQNSMRVDITWGAGTFLTLAGGATAVVNSITVDAQQVYFMVGPNPEDQPEQSFIYRVQEKTMDITATGESIMKPDLVQNRHLQRAYTEVVNNGAGMTATDVSNIRWQVSGSDNVINTTFNQQQYAQQEFFGRSLPRGLLAWFFDGGLGAPEFSSPRDVVDLSRVTEFANIFTISAGTAIASAYQRTIFEYLEKVPDSQY